MSILSQYRAQKKVTIQGSEERVFLEVPLIAQQLEPFRHRIFEQCLSVSLSALL